MLRSIHETSRDKFDSTEEVGPYDEFEFSSKKFLPTKSRSNQEFFSDRKKIENSSIVDSRFGSIIRTRSDGSSSAGGATHDEALIVNYNNLNILRPRQKKVQSDPDTDLAPTSQFSKHEKENDKKNAVTTRLRNIILFHFKRSKQFCVKAIDKFRRFLDQTRDCSCQPPMLALRELLHTILFTVRSSFISSIFHRVPQLVTKKKRKQKFFETVRIVHKIVYVLFISIIVLLLILFLEFVTDAVNICKAPQAIDRRKAISKSTPTHPEIAFTGEYVQPPPRPLIEYYIHGRGNGHFSRSIAIIHKLNAAGIDVRMFIGRATMWKEVHDANDLEETDVDSLHNSSQESLWLAAQTEMKIAKFILFSEEATAMMNEDSAHNESWADVIFDNLPWEKQTELQESFLSNYDMPESLSQSQTPPGSQGVTTAISVTSLIPKLSISSTISLALDRIIGDCEVSRQSSRYPTLVVSDGEVPGMLRAVFGSIPSVSVSHGLTFAISQQPDWEGNEREWKKAWHLQKWNNRQYSFLSDWLIGTNFLPLETVGDYGIVAKPPFRDEVISMARIREQRNKRHQRIHNVSSKTVGSVKRNKLIMCYFRDKNGSMVVNKLLESGFDVVEFHSAGKIPGKEIGKQWKVTKEMREKLQMQFTTSKYDSQNDTIRRELSALHASNDTKTNISTHVESFGGHYLENQNKTAHLKFNDASTVHATKQKKDTSDLDALLKIFNSTSNEPRSIKVYDKNLFVPFMNIVDGIVGSGGSQLLSESIYGRIPMLAFYRDGDTEQMLNIEMLRRKRVEDLDSAQKRNKAGIENVLPQVFGSSIESFISTFSNHHVTSEKENTHKNKRKNYRGLRPNGFSSSANETTITRDEVEGFIGAVQRSVISQSYYDDVFEFLRSPNDIDTRVENSDPKDYDGTLSPNNWLDGMPDAAEILIGIINEIF